MRDLEIPIPEMPGGANASLTDIADAHPLLGSCLHELYETARRTARGMHADRNTALQAAATAVVKVVRSIRDGEVFEHRGQLFAYVQEAVYTTLLDADRDERRRRARQVVSTSEEPDALQIPGHGEEVELNELIGVGFAMTAVLTERQRRTYELVYVQGMTSTEAARVLDCSPDVVKKQRQRILLTIGSILDAYRDGRLPTGYLYPTGAYRQQQSSAAVSRSDS